MAYVKRRSREGDNALMADKYQFQNLENRSKIQQICDFFQMGRVLKWTSLQIAAPCKSLLKLQTNQGIYSFKEYTVSKKNQLENAGFIKKIFTSHHIPLYMPLCLKKDRKNNFIYVCEDDLSCWSVTPWVFGQRLKLSDISISHVELMAKILGRIHKLKINFPEATEVLSGFIEDGGFSDFTFRRWRDLFEQHADLLKENCVISHGDLLPQNVIWETDQNPVLIDWDNAGWINQDIDLFNTAINWAGIESGLFNRSLYDYFIKAYLIENPRKIQIDKSLISASLGSWINWLIFNDKQGNKEAVGVTLRALEVLEREFF